MNKNQGSGGAQQRLLEEQRRRFQQQQQQQQPERGQPSATMAARQYGASRPAPIQLTPLPASRGPATTSSGPTPSSSFSLAPLPVTPPAHQHQHRYQPRDVTSSHRPHQLQAHQQQQPRYTSAPEQRTNYPGNAARGLTSTAPPTAVLQRQHLPQHAQQPHAARGSAAPNSMTHASTTATATPVSGQTAAQVAMARASQKRLTLEERNAYTKKYTEAVKADLHDRKYQPAREMMSLLKHDPRLASAKDIFAHLARVVTQSDTLSSVEKEFVRWKFQEYMFRLFYKRLTPEEFVQKLSSTLAYKEKPPATDTLKAMVKSVHAVFNEKMEHIKRSRDKNKAPTQQHQQTGHALHAHPSSTPTPHLLAPLPVSTPTRSHPKAPPALAPLPRSPAPQQSKSQQQFSLAPLPITPTTAAPNALQPPNAGLKQPVARSEGSISALGQSSGETPKGARGRGRGRGRGKGKGKDAGKTAGKDSAKKGKKTGKRPTSTSSSRSSTGSTSASPSVSSSTSAPVNSQQQPQQVGSSSTPFGMRGSYSGSHGAVAHGSGPPAKKAKMATETGESRASTAAGGRQRTVRPSASIPHAAEPSLFTLKAEYWHPVQDALLSESSGLFLNAMPLYRNYLKKQVRVLLKKGDIQAQANNVAHYNKALVKLKRAMSEPAQAPTQPTPGTSATTATTGATVANGQGGRQLRGIQQWSPAQQTNHAKIVAFHQGNAVDNFPDYHIDPAAYEAISMGTELFVRRFLLHMLKKSVAENYERAHVRVCKQTGYDRDAHDIDLTIEREIQNEASKKRAPVEVEPIQAKPNMFLFQSLTQRSTPKLSTHSKRKKKEPKLKTTTSFSVLDVTDALQDIPQLRGSQFAAKTVATKLYRKMEEMKGL